ncbi:MAG: OsmC family protein [Chloroflexi bacterium]|nr:OsmC family protein [Chloroflexota bacterium]MDA8217895.1 OsmC family protein [Dehalococcoidales bacterium]
MSLNNVDSERVGQTVAGFQANLDTARKTQRVEGVWNLAPGQPQFTARLAISGGEYVLEADQPPFLGGGGTRPGPVQYAVFGLAACYTATFVTLASGQGIVLEEVRTAAEFDLNFARVFGIADLPTVEEVRVTVSVRSNADEQTLSTLAQLAKERCPASYCLTNPIRLTPTVSRIATQTPPRG